MEHYHRYLSRELFFAPGQDMDQYLYDAFRALCGIIYHYYTLSEVDALFAALSMLSSRLKKSMADDEVNKDSDLPF